MTHHQNVKIVAFVGLAGSGKTTVTDYLTTKGYPKVYGGDIFYKAMDDAGLERTFENENAFRAQLQTASGPGIIFDQCSQQIRDLIAAGQHRIVSDGLFTWDEYKLMKQEFPGELSVIALVAPKHVRHHRLNVRPERPLTDNEANERDWREIEDIQVGGPIAIADFVVMNDKELDHLHEQIDTILKKIEFYS